MENRNPYRQPIAFKQTFNVLSNHGSPAICEDNAEIADASNLSGEQSEDIVDKLRLALFKAYAYPRIVFSDFPSCLNLSRYASVALLNASGLGTRSDRHLSPPH